MKRCKFYDKTTRWGREKKYSRVQCTQFSSPTVDIGSYLFLDVVCKCHLDTGQVFFPWTILSPLSVSQAKSCWYRVHFCFTSLVLFSCFFSYLNIVNELFCWNMITKYIRIVQFIYFFALIVMHFLLSHGDVSGEEKITEQLFIRNRNKIDHCDS